MATINAPDLQTLAAVEDDGAAAISVYIDLDPSTAPTVPAVASHLTAALDGAGQRRPADADRDAGGRFDAALARLREYADSLDRPETRTRGLALFAQGDDVFHAAWLARSAGDQIHVGRRPALLPLAALEERHGSLLVLVASREDGRLLLVRDGALVDVFDLGERIENRHKQGGWAQLKLQRYVDQAAEKHLGEVVERLARVHPELDRPPLLIGATEENAAVVRGQLTQELAEAVAGQVGDLSGADAGDLLDLADEWLHRLDCRREEELLERYAAQVGRGEADDRSADAALAAVSDARAEWLLVARAPDVTVHTCPSCGRLAAEPGACPLDGAALHADADGIHAAVARAVQSGTHVWQLIDVDRTDLDAGGGIGVVTRF